MRFLEMDVGDWPVESCFFAKVSRGRMFSRPVTSSSLRSWRNLKCILQTLFAEVRFGRSCCLYIRARSVKNNISLITFALHLENNNSCRHYTDLYKGSDLKSNIDYQTQIMVCISSLELLNYYLVFHNNLTHTNTTINRISKTRIKKCTKSTPN